jgi:hypothetical protein
MNREEINFCTLFDSNFLARGLAMYNSLVATHDNFILYIVCFDTLALKLLKKLQLPNLIPISLAEFETEELLAVKSTRSSGEYCWTCTSHVIRYILERFRLSELTYLDADLYFFNKPSILLDEFHKSNGSVLITEHRYTPEYDQTITSGIYCVQFMTFKADEQGLKVLQWWQDRCMEWCYARVEDGKFGDQKYLDHWPEMFEGIHVLQYLGGGVAPWNVQQYTIDEGPKVNRVPVVFYHFHGLQWFNNNRFIFSSYTLSPDINKYIYEPYVHCLKSQLSRVKKIDRSFNKGTITIPSKVWSIIIRGKDWGIKRVKKVILRLFR